MVLKLYMIYGSPLVHSVLMVAKTLHLQLELEEINVSRQEHLTGEFLKINPSEILPALDDDGFVIWESHSILCYLAEKYGKEDYNFYSKDLQEKTKINQILHLHSESIFREFYDCVHPVFNGNQQLIDSESLEKLSHEYLILERILTSSEFLALHRVTIADISVMSTIAICNMFWPVKEKDFPKLKAWMTKMEARDFYDACRRGIERFQEGLDAKFGPMIFLD